MNNPQGIARLWGARKRFVAMAASFFLTLACAMQSAMAAGLIRDAEIEDTLWMFMRPVLQQAGLNPNAVQLFVVNDPSVNAFVAGGANIFVHTGLITSTRNAGMLIGVLAHETGHIAGGHLIRAKEMAGAANIGLLIATVLGAAAAVGGGGGNSAAGAIMAGQATVQNSFLSYSRGQESSADQAALRFLDGAGWSSKGMLEMFEVLRQKEHRMFGQRDPYASTHPLAQERITTLRSHVLQSALAESPFPALFDLWTHQNTRLPATNLRIAPWQHPLGAVWRISDSASWIKPVRKSTRQ
jgi:predicted Zn-dependent protease